MLMKSSKFARYAVMLTLVCVMLIGFTAISFSKPVVLDENAAAQEAEQYVPKTCLLEGINDIGDAYIAHYSAESLGMNLAYDVTVDKVSQEVSNIQMDVNGIVTEKNVSDNN